MSIILGGAAADPNALSVGEETIPRLITTAAQALLSGQMRLTYFTAAKTELVSQVQLLSGGIAAGATPTLCRAGIYSVAANGDLTLAGSIANDTTLFSAASTTYTRSLSASFTKQAGQRYAFGILVVSAAAMPNIPCSAGNNAAAAWSVAPKLVGRVDSLTDLPASVTAAGVGATGQAFYSTVLP